MRSAIPCKYVCKNVVERGIGPVRGRARISQFRLVGVSVKLMVVNVLRIGHVTSLHVSLCEGLPRTNQRAKRWYDVDRILEPDEGEKLSIHIRRKSQPPENTRRHVINQTLEKTLSLRNPPNKCRQYPSDKG